MQVASRICNVVAEALVLGATWRVTYSIRKLARLLNMNIPLSLLLLRDGMSSLGLSFMIKRQ